MLTIPSFFVPPPSPIPSQEESSSLSRSSEPRYFFCPRHPTSFLPLGGLGHNTLDIATGKCRGRHSKLFLAQNKALVDMASGEQLFINGALRVANTPRGVNSWPFFLSTTTGWPTIQNNKLPVIWLNSREQLSSFCKRPWEQGTLFQVLGCIIFLDPILGGRTYLLFRA